MQTFMLIFFLSLTIDFGGHLPVSAAQDNSPYTPKAYLIRYWNTHIQNNLPKPDFLLSKASPLTAVQSATFAKLAADHAISTRLHEFCASAHLLCFTDLGQSLEKHDTDADFTVYLTGKNFTNYGAESGGGLNSFKNYSMSSVDLPVTNSFGRYSRGSAGHNESFTNYASDGNLIEENFNTYGTRTAGGNGDFQTYGDSVNDPFLKFAIYTTDGLSRKQDFNSYSRNSNFGNQEFTNYGKRGTGLTTKFSLYANFSNVVGSNFSSYDQSATGSPGRASVFQTYDQAENNPLLKFASYSSDAIDKTQDFSSYSVGANSGDQEFMSYGKRGRSDPTTFSSYSTGANGVNSAFSNYDKSGADANTKFNNYGLSQNVATNNFTSYGEGAVNGVVAESFSKYRDQANAGDDSFSSYVKNSNAAGQIDFQNYGKSFHEEDGSDKFSTYGKDTHGQKIDFKEYSATNTTFKEYAKEGVTFSGYTNSSSAKKSSTADSGIFVKRWVVEAGKFFRESTLKEGTVLPMPDIRDKMPKRSFLPRSILSKLPFSSNKISELKQILKVKDHSAMDKLVTDALSECERAPSPGETKHCVGSIEDMIDFASSVLGRNITVRTTQNTNGSKNNVMVGSVKGINGGKVTKSVSCHQTLFPYLLYYCHSVPTVRVYEVDLLDPNKKDKINDGVAICHIDTSSWSAGHGAFLALGSGPGRIEVCHWIFENDMTWTVAD